MSANEGWRQAWRPLEPPWPADEEPEALPGDDRYGRTIRSRAAPAASLRSAPDPPPPTGLRGLWASARLDPGLPGARALAIVGLVAVVIAAAFLWSSRPRPEPAPLSGSAPSSSTATMRHEDPAPADAATPGTRSSSLVVQVTGKVRRPGVVTLPQGSRVTDAIAAAGGLRPGADTGALNLARRVTDGEQIPVGIPGGPAPAAPGPAADPASTQVNLNTATAEQLQQLPGVGPVYAQHIIDYRTEHGGFRTVEELRQVSGIGEHRFAQLKPKVCI